MILWRNHSKTALLTGALLLLPTAYAQSPTHALPSSNHTDVLQRLGPALGSRYSNLITSTVSAMAQPETAHNLAIFTKNYYDALLEQGFSKADALRIVTSTRIPNMSEN